MIDKTIDTGALRALAEKATPGPWHFDGDELYAGKKPVIRLQGYECGIDVKDKDRAYIAATDPATVLALLEVADRHATLVEAVRKSNWNLAAQLAQQEGNRPV